MERALVSVKAETMIEDIEIEITTDVFNATIQEDFRNVISMNKEHNGKNLTISKHMISPFVMAMAGAMIMLSVSLCTMIALCMRIAMKRRMDKKRKDLAVRKHSMDSGCGGFEQQPRFVTPALSQLQISYFTNR